MPLYKQVSAQIHQIFQRYTSIIEPLSLDEAYLDVTDCTQCSGSATWIAQEIRQAIFDELKLTASAGVAPLKFLAKIASDMNKPNGQFVIQPHEVEQFVKTLPLKKIPGVGKVTSERLLKMGLETCEDVQKLDQSILLNISVKWASEFGILAMALMSVKFKHIENENLSVWNALYLKIFIILNKASRCWITSMLSLFDVLNEVRRMSP